MSYAILEKQIRALPEEYLDEVSSYIEFLLFRLKEKKDSAISEDKSSYFGSLPQMPDGMKLQRSARDEWN